MDSWSIFFTPEHLRALKAQDDEARGEAERTGAKFDPPSGGFSHRLEVSADELHVGPDGCLIFESLGRPRTVIAAGTYWRVERSLNRRDLEGLADDLEVLASDGRE